MNQKIATAFIVLFFGGMLLFKCTVKEETATFEAPLFDNLGDYTIQVTTESEYATRFVTQGVLMANAFNHAEAARSFREAIRLDSTCALAYWGLAYVLGPNYNTNSNQGERGEIRFAVDQALRYGKEATAWEQALIHTIEVKFPEGSEQADEEAYAVAMRGAYEQFPENDFIITLFAESIMNLHAWDLYTEKGGQPKDWTPEIVAALEKAMQLNPENPLANHLYIHAVEAAPDVEKGLVSAGRLKKLVPGAGHLVHMPSHIYINTGHYREGSEANEQAVIMDSIYIAECQVKGVYPQMYYPHNYHFLAATATLEGRGARAIEAAFKMAEIIDNTYLREPGYETTQHYITIPYNVLVKFAQWEKIVALPKPDNDLKYPTAIWYYAQGMAQANLGNLDKANAALDSLATLGKMDEVRNLSIWEINSGADIVTIAEDELRAEIAIKTGKYDAAINHLIHAMTVESQLNYNEPPDWFFSVRHVLGDAYLHTGQYALAEKIYREDLETFPGNGFALNGLYHCMHLQGKSEEAAKLQQQFQRAWERADVALKFSRIDEENRADLVLKMRYDTPNDLLYIAGSFCGLK